MDIHRCRFVHYPPSTINVLAFSHIQASREKKALNLRLALGRANGDIEIWNPLNGAWLQETVIRGGKDRSIDGLAWIQDPDEDTGDGKKIAGRLRLFSIGYTTTVTEWDLEKGQPLRQSSGNHGEIWCLAAQPPASSVQDEPLESGRWYGQNLVTGCTDGAIVLYSTADRDLKLERVLARPSARKAKVISIIFQGRNHVVAGCTDSTIRIYDIRNGTLLRSMSLGAGPAGGPKEIIVWTVKCLANGNIVSGDSTGELRIWDGKTYTLVQRIKSHRQDILSLATSVDGSVIFSGGMDRRTVTYKQVGGVRSRWAEVRHRRYHSHDVKTMATFEGKGMSVIISGGPDASPVVLPLREFGMENQRALPCLPQLPILQSAPKKRLLVSWWDREIHIWKIHKNLESRREDSDSGSESERQKRNRRLLAKVVVKGEASITSASITSDGNLLAVSTAAEIKIFRLKTRPSQAERSLGVSRVDVPQRLVTGGARLLQFSPDGKWLCVIRRDSQVVLVRLHGSDGESFNVLDALSNLPRLHRKTEKRVLLGGLGAYERTINRVSFSSDSRILAVSDLAGYVDTWLLEGREDLSQSADGDRLIIDASLPSSFSDHSDSNDDDGDDDDDDGKRRVIILGQHWIRNPSASLLPRLPSTAVVLAFRVFLATPQEGRPSSIAVPHLARHDPHPQPRNLPKGEDRLITVSASGQVLEFAVLKGSLSAWSRRNLGARFPEEFRGLRDQAMGCVWDIRDSTERLWLYGSSWMWMFDLSRDLPAQEAPAGGDRNGAEAGDQQSRPTKKRKFNGSSSSSSSSAVVDHLRRGTSGAGSKIPDQHLGTGISRKHQKILHKPDGSVEQSVLDTRRGPPAVEMEEEDEEEEEDTSEWDHGMGGRDADGAPELLRRQEDAASSSGANGHAPLPPHWWQTYKYRPIMGIVPLLAGEGEGEAGGLEVVLVERPAFELDLPPRYYGEQEWDKAGLHGGGEEEMPPPPPRRL